MPKVGEAYYELGVRDQALLSALGKDEAALKNAGKAGEQAFSQGAAKGLDSTAAAAGRFGGVVDKAGGATSKFGGIMKSVGQGVLQGVGIAGFFAVQSAASAVVGGFGRAISAASDLNETQSKVGVVFGKSANEILAWGKTSAQAMGLSQNAAEGAAATFGNLFLALKLPSDQIPKMSMSLVKLAGDLASFNNVSPEEALQALQSGLVGEVEPLRKFGVNLSEATLAQEAFSLGLVKTTTGVLPPAIRTQAAYSLIMKQTTTAQGDFARTSNGLANQQRIAAAKVEDAFAKLGQALLPIAATVVPLLADAFSGVADGIGVAIAGVQDFVASNQGLFDVIGTLVHLLVDVLGAALGAMAQAFGAAFGVVQNVVGAAFDVVKGVVSGIIGAIRNVISIAASIPGPWQESAQEMETTLNNMQASVESWGKSTVDLVGQTGNATPKTFAANLSAGAPAVATAAGTAIADPVAAAATSGKTQAVTTARETPGEIASALQKGKDAVASGADTLKQAFKDHISPTKEIARLEGDLTGKLMRQGLASNDPIIRGAAQQWKSDIEERLFVLRNGVGPLALQTGQSYGDALAAKKAFVATKAEALQRGAAHELAKLAANADDYGRSAGGAYASGLVSQGGYLARLTQKFLENAASNLRGKSPPKEGPFKDLDKWGENVGTTFADSFRAQGGYLREATQDYLRAGSFGLRGGPIPSQVPTPTIAQAMAPAPVTTSTSSTQSISIGDVHVALTLTGQVPTDSGQIRDLGRRIGEEVRLSLVRTPIAFPSTVG